MSVLGSALAETDPNGFTKTYQRNEMGEMYGATGPAPYNFQVQMYFDANRNTIRVDTQDWQVKFDSTDPSDANFGQFTHSGNGSTTANLPMQAGPGGALRPAIGPLLINAGRDLGAAVRRTHMNVERSPTVNRRD